MREVAKRLQTSIRPEDTVARLSGDEFTMVLGECDIENAFLVSERVQAELARPFLLHAQEVYISASIGIALYPNDSRSADSLVRFADSAMYRAKELGRNRAEFYSPSLQHNVERRSEIAKALREAIRFDRLRIVLQPKYRLEDGIDAIPPSAEALLRWHDSELGEIGPGEFVPVAESYGLINELTSKALDLLLHQTHAWRERGVPSPVIALNISAFCIRERGFAERMLRTIRDSDTAPELFQVEITESALLDSSEAVITNLSLLASANIKIAIDDFGTGYSSLSYLKRLPIHEVKIDRTFVSGLTVSREDEAIVEATIGLSRALGLVTTAEGVETEEQRLWLLQHGCLMSQGYLYNKPLEVEEFERLVLSRQ